MYRSIFCVSSPGSSSFPALWALAPWVIPGARRKNKDEPIDKTRSYSSSVFRVTRDTPHFFVEPMHVREKSLCRIEQVSFLGGKGDGYETACTDTRRNKSAPHSNRITGSIFEVAIASDFFPSLFLFFFINIKLLYPAKGLKSVKWINWTRLR